ncbi:PREDICTED: atherin-like [Condylura cristata]|uniref:atherin-like n=1 Tax=Condylura cristata TaxID=143302 RepID=UPI000642CB8C|nr:PREDICTED: atherin-like [Condylura cristata]
MAKAWGSAPPPSTHDLSPNLLPDVAASGRLSAPRRAAATSPLQPGARPPKGGAGRVPAAAHLPGPRALRLRLRASRLCSRPRKPPAPPAAAEASQRLGMATAAAATAAVAALLPRGSRSAPASTGAEPTSPRGEGGQHNSRLRGAAPKQNIRLAMAPGPCYQDVQQKKDQQKGLGPFKAYSVQIATLVCLWPTLSRSSSLETWWSL